MNSELNVFSHIVYKTCLWIKIVVNHYKIKELLTTWDLFEINKFTYIISFLQHQQTDLRTTVATDEGCGCWNTMLCEDVACCSIATGEPAVNIQPFSKITIFNKKEKCCQSTKISKRNRKYKCTVPKLNSKPRWLELFLLNQRIVNANPGSQLWVFWNIWNVLTLVPIIYLLFCKYY